MSVSADGVFDLDSVQCFLTEPLLTKIKDLLCDNSRWVPLFFRIVIQNNNM